MTSSAPFQLATSIGKADKLIVGQQLLAQRLRQYRALKPEVRNLRDAMVWVEKTHIVYVNHQHRLYAAITQEYTRIGPTNAPIFGADISFQLPTKLMFVHDMFLQVKFAASGDATQADTAPRTRYTRKPGLRLLENVRLLVNHSAELNEYDIYRALAYDKFEVPPGRRRAWNRCIGQEEILEGHTYDYDHEVTAIHPFSAGPQTLKKLQPSLEMMIPLLFEQCKRIEKALPICMLPVNKISVHVKLAQNNDLIEQQDPATFVVTGNPEINIQTFDLWVNYLNMSDELMDIYRSTVNFIPVRIFKQQLTELKQASNNVKLDKIKFPVETLYLGFQPKSNLLDFDLWDLWGTATPEGYCVPVIITRVPPAIPPKQLVSRATIAYDITPMIDLIGMNATGGIIVFPMISPRMFTSYVPQRFDYSCCSVSTDEDTAAMMLTWRQKPGEIDFDGFWSISRVRETYVSYTSTQISATNIADFIVVAQVVQFLLLADGDATQRYLT